MEQKAIAVLGATAVAGFITIGIILAVRMPKEETATAFATLVNAARGLAIAENGIC